MGSTPFSCLIGGVAAFIVATLVRLRAIWFLREDTILSGGKEVSTAELAATISRFLYLFGALAIVLAIILLLTLSEDRKQRIARLPRWKRFFFWPIDSHIAPRKPADDSLRNRPDA